MQKISLQTLTLKNYRNFSNLELEFQDKVVVIIGQNGSGKTNILESISLLSPGRGLRSARLDEIVQIGQQSWHSSFKLQSKLGLSEISTDFLQSGTRKIDYNGSKIANNELPSLTSMIWLTPQMEGVFLGSSSDRRRFLDRIVYSFDSMHAKRINKYDYYMKQRLKVLTQHDKSESDIWLTGLEEAMASAAHEIDQKRREILAFVQNSIDGLDTQFPKAKLEISNLLENNNDNIDFTEYFKNKLKENRKKDEYSGRTNFGVHKTDFIVSHQEKKQLAKYCSTGEQKAMLISIILAQIDSLKKNAKILPLVLLDELFVHLDKKRREYLSDYIFNSNIQTFITATETSGVITLASDAQLIEVPR